MILLVNNQLLISEIEQKASELGEPDCRLTNPYFVDQESMEISLWMKDYVSPGTSYFDIHSDKILTLFKPRATLLEKYEELTK
jgi:hypothetical protein